MTGGIKKSIFRSFAFFQKKAPKYASKIATVKPEGTLTNSISIPIEKQLLQIAEKGLDEIILKYIPDTNSRDQQRIHKEIINSFSSGDRVESLKEKLSKEFLIEPDTAKKLALYSLSSLSAKYRQARYQDLEISETIKTPNCDSQEFLEWIMLREKFREAKRDKNYLQIIDACHAIIELDERARFIGIMTPLFYKDAGRAYLKLSENQKALYHFQTAKSQFIEYRRNHKLSHPDDWLRDINFIEKTIRKLI